LGGLGIPGRLGRLEREVSEFYETLKLPDGTEVCYTGEEMLEALCACIERREHRLLPYLRRAEPDTTQGMPGLVRAIEGSRERAS
jgi:hypothetical protein